MKKIRYYLAAIALVVTLSVPTFLGVGAGSMTNAVSGTHSASVSASSMDGKSMRSIAFKPFYPCPWAGSDC